MNIDELIFDDKNFNLHTTEGMALIERSLREHGAGRSVLIDKDNRLIGGNGVVEAAKAVGISKVKVVEVEGDELVAVKRKDVSLDSKKGRAMALADNATAAADLAWDEEAIRAAEKELNISAAEWGLDFGALDATLADAQEDKVEDDNFESRTSTDPESKPGDIWQLGEHRLICGDSTKPETISALMGGEMSDLLLTDPPYNVAYKAKGKKAIENDNMSDANFVAFLEAAFQAADSVLKPGAGFYIWHADIRRESFLEALHAVPWTLRQILVWNKNSFTLGRQDYQWKHEPCLYGWKDGAAHYFIDRRNLTTVLEQPLEYIDNLTMKEMKEILLKLRDEMPTTLIDCDKPLKSELHPTMKPVTLIGIQVRNSTRRGDIVLDVFGGSGTTLIACEKLHRRCRIVEYSPTYVDVIVSRWEKLTGQKAQLLQSGGGRKGGGGHDDTAQRARTGNY